MMNKNHVKKIIAILLSVVLLFSISIPVFAESTTKNSLGSVDRQDDGKTVGFDETQEQQTEYTSVEGSEDTSTSVQVYASQASSYIVTVPAVLIVDGAYDGMFVNEFTYEVSVKGNIAGNEEVYVEPQNDIFTMSSAGKEDIEGNVLQDKTTFSYEDGVRTDEEITAIGLGSISGMTAGLWSGEFSINIGIKTM